jgi:hypothetical protein
MAKKLRKYYYTAHNGECQEQCRCQPYYSQGICIGSIACKDACKNIIGSGKINRKAYIICKVIDKATGKEK